MIVIASAKATVTIIDPMNETFPKESDTPRNPPEPTTRTSTSNIVELFCFRDMLLLESNGRDA